MERSCDAPESGGSDAPPSHPLPTWSQHLDSVRPIWDHVSTQQINTWAATYNSNWMWSFHHYATISTHNIECLSVSSLHRERGVDLTTQLMVQVMLRACSGFSREFHTGQWTILEENEFPVCWWPTHGEQIKRHVKLYAGIWNSVLMTEPVGWRSDNSEV